VCVDNEYDLIVAVSSLEHVRSAGALEKVIQQMSAGTRNNGINCIIVNSEVEEIDMNYNEKLDALIEINISTKEMVNKLKRIYDGWEVLSAIVKPFEYKINRNERPVLLKTNTITYVVRKGYYFESNDKFI
jgi:hypothetical protein